MGHAERVRRSQPGAVCGQSLLPERSVGGAHGALAAWPHHAPPRHTQVIERRTPLGAVLSAPLVSMLLALAGAAAGLLPAASPVYDCVWTYLMPLAAAMYLLESDLRQ